MQIFGGAHKTTLRREVRGVDYQSLALPAAARVPVPGADFCWKMRATIERNDPSVVERLHENNDVSTKLHDLIVPVVARPPAPTNSRYAWRDAAHRTAEVLRS